ncbi:MAG TPA: hypothetical protein VK609_19145, partial [Mucilaginibacter sp.]|nr:hypothetical protein [Mucilaginibacter sp.]
MAPDITTLEEFYKQTSLLLPEGINKDIGHFNVFKIDEMMAQTRKKGIMPYNRRAYYKISMISGHNRAEYADKVIDIEKNDHLICIFGPVEYADKVIDIEKNALLFATPK